MIYPGAVWRPGRNAGYAAGRNRMQLCVCHYTVGRVDSDLSVMDRGYFNFLVARDGTVYQGAEADALTWHAGTANAWGPGIEVSYLPGVDDELWTPEAYAATADLVAWLIGLGIPDAFYDGPRIDPAGFSGFLTHRSVQQPDGHSDWWPELPRRNAPKENDRMKPGLFLDKPSGRVYVYDPNNNTKTWLQTPEALAAWQALAAVNGVSTDIVDNATSRKLLADAVDLRATPTGAAACKFAPAPTTFRAV